MLFIVPLLIANILIAIIISIYCKLTTGICKCSRHLVGKVVIITGGNSGIAFETAKDLASRGARVILAYKVKTKGTAVRDLIASTGNDNICSRELDLASLTSVKKFANNIIKTEKRIDILINNAEVFEGDNIKTEDGLSLYMQVNYFGHFLLTCMLLPLLKSSSPSRIINISSEAHRRVKFELDNLNNENVSNDAYNRSKAFRTAKICNILMTLELARRLEGTSVTSNCLNPGIISTSTEADNTLLARYLQNIVQPFFKSTWEGAQTTIFLAVSPEVECVSGKYYSDCREKKPAQCARDTDVARKLWEISQEIVGLKK